MKYIYSGTKTVRDSFLFPERKFRYLQMLRARLTTGNAYLQDLEVIVEQNLLGRRSCIINFSFDMIPILRFSHKLILTEKEVAGGCHRN